MKHIHIFLLPFLFMACGIADALFPIEYPQRYIEREVNSSELVGTWNITADSETRIESYLQHPDDFWPASPAPWKSVTLNQDGSCEIQFETSWADDNDALKQLDAPSTCAWKVRKIAGYDKQGSSKYVPGLTVYFGRYNKKEDQYYGNDSESYIVIEDNKLVLWNFIGDPEYLRYQDFHKINQ